jgi:hypothetical protein
MIECMSYVPEFYLEGEDASSMSNAVEFHDRILEFVEKNLSGEINEITLCHFITMDGAVMTAKLPKNAYKQSIEKSMEFYIENENYEKCNRIKKLLEQI